MSTPFDGFADFRESCDELRHRSADWSGHRVVQAGGSVLGVVLGSGLGGLADQIQEPIAVAYGDLPGLPPSTAAGHRGQFIFGRLEGTPVVAMAGRLHVYEGHPLTTVTRPIAMLAEMGVTDLVVSCAAGGLNPRLTTGDLVLLDERISWLAGRMGAPVFPAQANPSDWPPQPRPKARTTDPELARLADQVAAEHPFSLHRGTYLATTGPTYETRAECRMMRAIGVDVVGMSTVPELIAAESMSVRTLGLAVVTNMALPDSPVTADHADVLAVSRAAGDRLESIVRRVADSLAWRPTSQPRESIR